VLARRAATPGMLAPGVAPGAQATD
jgi:hypothetical protein